MCHRCGGCEEKSCQEKAASFEGEEAAGKARLPTPDRRKTPRCPPAASPGSGPASLLSPRTRSSNPGAAPRPPRSRSQPPAEIPYSPARGRRAALPAPAGSPSALAERPPAPSPTTFLRSRVLTSTPPRRPTHTQARGPPRARPAPRGRQTMSSHNSPAAPELRGSGGGSSPPSPAPSPPTRSGIRPPGDKPPALPSLLRDPPPPPGRRPRSLPEESHFIPRSNMAAPPAAAAAVALPRLPAAGERPQAVRRSRPLGGRRCRERRGWPRVSRAGPRECAEKRRPEPGCASPLQADASARSQRGGSH